MEIQLVEILKNEGKKESFTINETMEDTTIDFCGEIIAFKNPIEVSGYMVNYEGKIHLEMSIKTSVERTCSRCLRAYNDKMDINADYVFVKDIENNDEDINIYTGDSIDIRDKVLSEIIGQISMKPLCKDDCKGLCPICGKDRNIIECGCTIDEIDQRFEVLKSLLDKE